MNTRFLLRVPLFALAAALPQCGIAQNWPQWRGPNQDGSAPDAKPPITWSETNNVKWKVPIPGDSTTTPLLWGDKLFIQSAVPTGRKEPSSAKEQGSADQPSQQPPRDRFRGPPPGGPGGPPDGRGPGPGGRGPGGRRGGGEKPTEVTQFTIFCLERKTGKTLWQQVAKETVPHEGVKPGDGSFSANTGVTDGENVYAYFGSEGLYCYDLNGKQKWTKDLGKMKVLNSFGEGSSPALYKQTIVVQWDNEETSFITALDKNTGKELWKQPREERTSWATPLIVECQGKPQIITSATGKIRSYDLATGNVIWECGGLTRNVIPTPVTDHEYVYCMSGFQGNAAFAIKLSAKGDITDKGDVVWTIKKSTPYVPSPLLYDGKLWYFSKNDGILTSVASKTGKVLIDAERLEEIPSVYASPLGADGRVYLVGRNGTTVVLRDSDKVEKLAVNKLNEKIDASPVASGKELFLRGRQSLYCIAEK
jgi:outer membrane protein assembly factor BamB